MWVGFCKLNSICKITRPLLYVNGRELLIFGCLVMKIYSILVRFAGFALLVCLSGCAALPGGVPVQGPAADQVRRAFNEMKARQQQCPSGIDADVKLTFNGFMSSGSINGYLLTFPPAYLRFEGINPLGLTENILTTNGHRFDYVLVRRQRVYSGWLVGKTQKYLTPEQADFMSYWLIGRMPPAHLTLVDVERGPAGDYWLELRGAGMGAAQASSALEEYKVLFSPHRGTVDRYVAVAQGGHRRLDVTYHYPGPESKADQEAGCPVPDLVDSKLDGHDAMSIAIRKTYPVSYLNKQQFVVKVPNEFERIDLP